jgi:hypothetical protein
MKYPFETVERPCVREVRGHTGVYGHSYHIGYENGVEFWEVCPICNKEHRRTVDASKCCRESLPNELENAMLAYMQASEDEKSALQEMVKQLNEKLIEAKKVWASIDAWFAPKPGPTLRDNMRKLMKGAYAPDKPEQYVPE